MSKKVFFILIAVTLVFGLVVSSPALAKLKVGMVFDIGGKGDQSFNDSAYRGLQWASEKFGIAHVEIEPGADADRETGLRMIASQGFDLVIAILPNMDLIIIDNVDIVLLSDNCIDPGGITELR